jgi:hypothetical protein
MSDLQDALDRWDARKGVLTQEYGVIVDAARRVASLPSFPGFDCFYDHLVVRNGGYIDEDEGSDEGLIQWVIALLILFKDNAALGITEDTERT